ncbi:Bacterial Ig-like domain (group 2) [compost metagenome]
MTLADIQGKLEWSSSNPAVVSVSENGLITGIIKGSATVTATYKDNPAIKDSVQVNVINEDRY